MLCVLLWCVGWRLKRAPCPLARLDWAALLPCQKHLQSLIRVATDLCLPVRRRWLQDQLPPEVSARCYFFNSFFYKKLTEKQGENWCCCKTLSIMRQRSMLGRLPFSQEPAARVLHRPWAAALKLTCAPAQKHCSPSCCCCDTWWWFGTLQAAT